MSCATCGAGLDDAGQAHTCPVVPSADWELAGRRVIRFAVAYGAAAAAVIPLFVQATRGPFPGVAIPALLLIVNLAISAVLLGGLLGLLICVIVWVVQTVRLSRSYGSPAAGHLGYWGIGLFVVLFATAYLRPAGVTASAALLVQSAERLIAVVALIAGVAHTRRWIGRRSPAPAAVHPSSRPAAGDWDASVWDPEVQHEISRRRRS
ncbi:hypothetical protein [Actinoplanes awajinensis]|uniref:hypothetical protein n=1 Tax=Actinoplanes awajinensis TaxID=135946 RepID=UPI000A612270|nr:hypothetical protein [Actinoplanes awajinensis]